jgi:hypothetical protein
MVPCPEGAASQSHLELRHSGPTHSSFQLARLVYLMLRAGTAYKNIDEHYYEERYRAHPVAKAPKQATRFGFHLTPQQSK